MEIISSIRKLPGVRRIGELVDAIFAQLAELQLRQCEILERQREILERQREILEIERTISERLSRLESLVSVIKQLDAQVSTTAAAVRGLNLAQILPTQEAGYTVVITPNEINDQHGTGALVKRVFGRSADIFSIRSIDHYGGDHSFGEESMLLPNVSASRPKWFSEALSQIQGRVPRRIVCVPFLPDDLRTSIALKKTFGSPLAVWLMDDQNITTNNIPDELMREFLGECALRLTTHSEMRDAYEQKYGYKFFLLPAVVPGNLIATHVITVQDAGSVAKNGAILGSIWSQSWLDRLKQTLTEARLVCDWYGNNKAPYLQTTDKELMEAGINAQGLVPEDVLAERLKSYPYVIVPSGSLDERDGARHLAELSLPGRILFAVATSNTPVIVLGSETTPAARFVREMDVGMSANYDPESLCSAIERVTKQGTQARMRENAVRIASAFSADGISNWVFRSLELGRPADDRFERLMPA